MRSQTKTSSTECCLDLKKLNLKYFWQIENWFKPRLSKQRSHTQLLKEPTPSRWSLNMAMMRMMRMLRMMMMMMMMTCLQSEARSSLFETNSGLFPILFSLIMMLMIIMKSGWVKKLANLENWIASQIGIVSRINPGHCLISSNFFTASFVQMITRRTFFVTIFIVTAFLVTAFLVTTGLVWSGWPTKSWPVDCRNKFDSWTGKCADLVLAN